MDPWPTSEAIGDQFAVGFHSPHNALQFVLGTVGVGGTMAVKYWNGSALVAVSGLTDGTSNLTANGTVTFTMPTDWKKQVLNNTAPALYYLYFEVAGTYSTNPVISQGILSGHGPHDRYEVVSKLLKDYGGTLHSFFLSFGDYDGVAIAEFPDNTAATACLLTILRSGAVSQLKTTVLISPKEALKAMKLAGNTTTGYLPPSAGLAD